MSCDSRVYLSTVVLVIWLVMASTPLHAAQLQLTWNAPTTNADDTPLVDLAGYRLYYGATSGNYTQHIDVGNFTTYLLSGLSDGQMYSIVVTAYDTSGNESAFSAEVSATPTTSPPPPPVASFAGTPLTGSAPLTVAFTDMSTGQVTTWSWSFGDAGNSSVQNPHHTYTDPGTYSVTLTVDGPGGNHTAARLGYITVNPPPTTSTGLVAAYGFDEGNGPKVADASGNGNHDTVSGAKWTNAGRYGKALLFDGINDWVTVADSPALDLTTGMTLQAWVYPTALGGGMTNGWRTVILKQQSGQLIYALYANSDANRPSGYVYTSSDLGVFGDAQLPLSAWRHLATTYDGLVLRLYVDGVLVGSRSLTGGLRTSGNPLRIGGNSVWGEYFKGRIDEVRIYNRALSAGQIQTDMHTAVSLTGAGSVASLPTVEGRRWRGPRHGVHARDDAAIDQVKPATDMRRLRARHSEASLAPSSPSTRATSEDRPHLMEVGEVLVTRQWRRVVFRRPFIEPIVIVNATSVTDDGLLHLAIRHVVPMGFDIRLQPLNDMAETATSAVAGFLTLERGTYTLADGAQVEAGRVVARSVDAAHTIAFSRRFRSVPVVMTAVAGTDRSGQVTSRLQVVTRSGLRVHLNGQHPEAQRGQPETLSYIAWEPSMGRLQEVAFEARRVSGIGRGRWHPLAFRSAFDLPPVLLAEVQGNLSDVRQALRWDAKHLEGVEVTLETELPGDDVPEAAAAVVGYIALR